MAVSGDAAHADLRFVEEVLAVFKKHNKELSYDYVLGWYVDRLQEDTIERVHKDVGARKA